MSERVLVAVRLEDMPEYVAEQLEAIDDAARNLREAVKALSSLPSKGGEAPAWVQDSITALHVYAKSVCKLTDDLREHGAAIDAQIRAGG